MRSAWCRAAVLAAAVAFAPCVDAGSARPWDPREADVLRIVSTLLAADDAALVRAVTDPDAIVRAAGLEAAWRTGRSGGALAAAVRSATSDPEALVRRHAFRALPAGPQDEAAVVAGLADPDEGVRAAAVRCAGRLEVAAPRLGPRVRGLLRDTSADVRSEAARCLARPVFAADSVELLAPLVEDPDRDVRREAARALEAAGRAGAEVLAGHLGSREPFLLPSAVAAVARHGRDIPGVRESLADVAADERVSLRVRLEARETLAGWRTPARGADRRLEELLGRTWLAAALAGAVVMGLLGAAALVRGPRIRSRATLAQGALVTAALVAAWAYEILYQPGGLGRSMGGHPTGFPLHFGLPLAWGLGVAPAWMGPILAAAAGTAVARRLLRGTMGGLALASVLLAAAGCLAAGSSGALVGVAFVAPLLLAVAVAGLGIAAAGAMVARRRGALVGLPAVGVAFLVAGVVALHGLPPPWIHLDALAAGLTSVVPLAVALLVVPEGDSPASSGEAGAGPPVDPEPVVR